MSRVWEVKMRALLCLLLAACAFANKTSDNRRTKLPFVADAVGNTLPPPSSVPASVGSPVKLLTPDRYEFYTFDESGELVKRLMTLEEIQAIVAAGEENEGLVTFANENQPTIAFNFSQPSHTKVHSVVTNVQNVLKAQMEAHKNKPPLQPTLDTPDVSDSWSLILPSIFGNTGVDIVPDKSSGTFTTPETETFELDQAAEVDENILGKEDIIPTTLVMELNPVTEKTMSNDEEIEPATTTTTTSTSTTTITTTTPKPLTTTTKKVIVSTTPKVKPSTTKKPITTTQRVPIKTTRKPNPTVTTNQILTTLQYVNKTMTKTTTSKPETTTGKQIENNSIIKDIDNRINVQIQPNSNNVSSTEIPEKFFEKISTFIPVSTVKYVTTRVTTPKPDTTTKSVSSIASTTKRSVPTTMRIQILSTTPLSTTSIKPIISTTTHMSSTSKEFEIEKLNITTITTQSVSPSTTVSTTEFLSAHNFDSANSIPTVELNDEASFDNDKDNEPILPLFDVAQSISQIASDLGNNYQPIPTTADILDATKTNPVDLESKENMDLDIPPVTENETELSTTTPKMNTGESETFIKISTLDPHENFTNTESKTEDDIKEIQNRTVADAILDVVHKLEVTTISNEETTIDPVLSESMGDLLSQVSNENPQAAESDVNDDEFNKNESFTTTEKILDTTTADNIEKFTEITSKIEEEALSVTTDPQVKQQTVKESPISTTPIVVFSHNRTKEDDLEVKNIETTTLLPENSSINKETTENLETNVETDNFVQIAMFSDKNETKAKSEDNIVNVTGILNNINTTDISTDKPEVGKENKENIKKLESVHIETATIAFADETPTTKVLMIDQSKFSPSKINKINLNDKLSNVKKDKLPEPLPKIDDFKKKIQKVNIEEEELINKRNNSWKLVPTLSPPKVNEISKEKLKSENHYVPDNDSKEIVLDYSQENQGLEVTTRDLGEDIAQFTELCNELAFRYWNVMVQNVDKRRSFVLSPYSITSMLAMMFMGARGATSGEMNEILKLDDMVTFNPHFTLKNISDSIDTSTNSGVAISAFIRELYSDRTKGKILTFYKERAQHFYNGHVEEINFKLISDIIRRRTNLLVKRYTWGKIPEYIKSNNIVMQPPLAAFSANIFETDCTGTSVDGRDGEMYFVVSPNVRQRRLVPVPAVVYKNGFLAGYDPVLDATAAALGNTNSIVSTLFLMPGQQGNVVHADDLEKLEHRLLDSNPTTPTWSRLLRSLLPRMGLELQIPRFSHKSNFNVSSTLRKMGLKELFDSEHADLGGLNGPSKDLYLSDMIQLTTFVTCGEGVVGDQHHIEEYPENLALNKKRRSSRWANDWDEPRDYQRAFHDPHDVGDAMHLPLHLRPRQARLPSRSAQPARLKYDRPFLYFVRHNPSGMILYFGRYNPRLLP